MEIMAGSFSATITIAFNCFKLIQSLIKIE